MKLCIDGLSVKPNPGQSLLDLVRQLGLEDACLSRRPLAAKMAGEVFTLNYIPLREKDASAEQLNIRRAMEASKGVVRLLRYSDEAGKDAYIRTALFVIFLALRQLWPEARAIMNCTLGSSVFFEVTGAKDFSAGVMKEIIGELVREDIPLIRRRIPLKQAIDRCVRDGQQDKARLLSWRSVDFFDEYA